MAQRQQRAFLQAVRLAGEEPNGFRAGEVMMVEAMWSACQDEGSVAGFVLALLSGRRVYLQIVEDYGEAGPVEEALVLDMPANERVPGLQGLGAVAWRFDALPELNALLAA